MKLWIKISLFLVISALSLSACANSVSTQDSASEPETIVTPSRISELLNTQTPEPQTQLTESATADASANANMYSDCGEGGLIDVPYFFKDVYGENSPTQLVRFQTTSDKVRDFVSVITCLKHDEGWVSDPDEVENGYENEIEFFDKNGISHTYRIIIGGHYVAPYDPSHKDITASLNGVDTYFYSVEEWIDTTRDYFVSTGSRQVGVDIYLDDTQGDLSRVLTQVYQFRETNLQIAEALKTGEGYPDDVPDGFFLFATSSWLIQPD